MKTVAKILTALLLSVSLFHGASAAPPVAKDSAQEMSSASDQNLSLDLKWIEELEEAWMVAVLSGDTKEAEALAEFLVVLELFVYDDITRIVEHPRSKISGASLGSGR
ncbi:MAG: hypothetical protein AAGD07_13815 [Planctomycetota bacterium]